MAHDHLFMPVVRPNLPPLSASAVRISEEEMVPPPMLLPSPPPNMPLQITATGKRIKVSCPRFEALCNRVSHLPSGDRILLEGKVRLTYRGNEAGKVSADRVEVDLADGAVEVNPAPAPARPVVPVGYFTPVSRQMPAPTEP